jgi:hypothetical protein
LAAFMEAINPDAFRSDALAVKRKRLQRARHWVWIVAVIWVAQIATLAWFFRDVTWEDYWFCRSIYRPGLRLFNHAGEGLLPGHFFSPFDRRGILAGFCFASLAYALALGAGIFVTHRAIMRK